MAGGLSPCAASCLSSQNTGLSLKWCLILKQLLLLGVIGQWVVKPLLGILLASTVVPALRLPNEVTTGLVLVGSQSSAAPNCSVSFVCLGTHRNIRMPHLHICLRPVMLKAICSITRCCGEVVEPARSAPSMCSMHPGRGCTH